MNAVRFNATTKSGKQNKASGSKQISSKSTEQTSTQSLSKPGPPSEKYEAPQYFEYNQYSYNDLIKTMESFRLPQPIAK